VRLAQPDQVVAAVAGRAERDVDAVAQVADRGVGVPGGQLRRVDADEHDRAAVALEDRRRRRREAGAEVAPRPGR
jgi:hypothetical protein